MIAGLPLATLVTTLVASLAVLWGVTSRRLAFVLVLVVAVVEEAFVAGLSAEDSAQLVPSWMRLGHGFWIRPPDLPSLAVVVAVVAAAVGLGFGQRALAAGSRRMWIALALLVVWTTVVTLADGGGMGGAIRLSSPWLLVVGGSAAARVARRLPSDRRVVVIAALLLLIKFGQGFALVRSTPLNPFFDAMVPMAAGVVLIALIFRRPTGVSVPMMWFSGALCVLVLLLAQRRTPIVVSVLLAVLMAGLSHPRTVLRFVGIAIVAFTVVPLVAPTQTARVIAGLSTVVGSGDDESTEGHVSDIGVGASAVLRHPLAGLGPAAPQLDGAANRATDTIYLHNEYLQVWLRFGLPAVVLLGWIVISGVHRSYRLLQRAEPLAVNLAALLCLAVPLCMLLFPPITGSQRWALLYGVGLGFVHSFGRRQPSGDRRPLAPRASFAL